MKNKIFLALKEGGGLTAEEIAKIINVQVDGVLFFFSRFSDYFEAVGGKWYIKHVIDKLPDFTRFDWQYSKVISQVDSIPESYRNPFIDYVVHREQGYRGTCVGQAAAYFADINYLQLLEDKPTEDEMKQFARNIFIDTLYPTSFSAESAYKWSRDELNINLTSGSYVSASVLSLTKKGICSERLWPTAKTESYIVSEPADAISEGSFHKTSGYAEILNFDHACNAIYKHGVIVGALRVYENYGSGFTLGEFPEPMGKLIGGHALCFIGYDKDYLYCLHSWGSTTPKIGRVSKAYFNAEAYHVYAILDEEEVKILRNRFATLKITSNVEANIYANNQYAGKGNVNLSFPLDSTVTIKATYGNEQQTQIVCMSAAKDISFQFTIEPPRKTNWLIELLKWLLSRYIKK
ncbi:MAG: C1 family peptidase [Bacteroidales bacterium]|nr:C1 family peptidase [Bacteroidales bacterium]